jgi:hypothetical protein
VTRDTGAAAATLGQLLEQTGQHEQGDDRQGRDDQAGELGMGAGAAVDRGLGQAAVDDHPAREARGEVRAAEPEQLAVGVDLVVLTRGVGLRRAEAFGEPDEHHGDATGGEQAELMQAHVRKPERRQPAVDVADDVDVEIERGDCGDAHQHGGERSRHDRREPAQAEFETAKQRVLAGG